jgi:hypothetical protein
MTTIDRYVRDLIGRLPAAGDLRERVREEVEGHLNDAISDLERQGLPPARAEERAVARFGSAEAVARRLLQELELLMQPLLPCGRPRLLLARA